jgi:hypothetical protein
MDPWRHRRRLVYGSLIFDATVVVGCIVLATFFGMPESLANMTITMVFTHGGGVLGAYVAGAVVDDKNRRHLGGPAE